MRTRNRPPALRAKHQARSAVRRLPRCRLPDGLGAKRPVVTSTAGSGPGHGAMTTVNGTWMVRYWPRVGPTSTNWS